VHKLNNLYFVIAKKLNAKELNNMHNLKANFDKMLDICKQIGKEFTTDRGNMIRCGVVPRFSDLEIVALSLTAESLSIDSESHQQGDTDQRWDKEIGKSLRTFRATKKRMPRSLERV
jgi:hypothetical protein